MEFIDIQLPVITEKPPDNSLSSEIQFIPSGEKLERLLHSTAEYLNTLTNSDGYIIYSLDDAARELYICSTNATAKLCFNNRYKWRIKHGDTIAIYVFRHMTPILVDSKTSVDLNFPYLQALPGLYPRYILSLPLVNFQKRCLGVVEYFRDNGRQYNDGDVKLCQFLLQNCAEAFKQNENAVFFTKVNANKIKLQQNLEMYTFQDEHQGSNNFSHEVVLMARDCTRGMSSAFFIKKQGDLVSIVNSENEEYFQNEEDKKNELGTIMRSLVTVNFHTTLLNRNIHGAIKVYNKIGFSHFSLLDKQILEALARMCTLWSIIEYMSGYLKKQIGLNENILTLINLQLDNAEDFGKKIHVLVPTDLSVLNSWNYSLETPADRKQLLSDAVTMISRVKGGLPVTDKTLKEFVLMVEQCHRNDKESDYQHTILCVQSLYRFLDGCSEVASDIEGFAMIIASLCHNIAVSTNPTAKSPIFGRYNLYPNELIQFEIVQFLIQETRLLSQFDKDDQNWILKMIKEFMVAMNLDCFKLNMAEFSKVVGGGSAVKIQYQTDVKLRSLIQSILPAVGNILGHFKSQPFNANFPNFSLFQHLERNQLTCIDIIIAVSPM